MTGAYEARMNAGREIMREEAQTWFDDGTFDDQIRVLITEGEFDGEVVDRAKKLGMDYLVVEGEE